MKIKTLRMFIFLIVFSILLSGCINTTPSQNNKYTTQEFNLKGNVQITPSTPYKGGKVSIVYTLTNYGSEEITIIPPSKEDLSLTCISEVTSFTTIPYDVLEVPLYILKPQESISFVWDAKISKKTASKECKGSMHFKYEDTAVLVKYIPVIKESELTQANYKPGEDNSIHTYNDGNIVIRAYISPSDPLILSPDDEIDKRINIEIKNQGDGEINIGKIRLNTDENIYIPEKRCLQNRRNTLKSGEKILLSCPFSIKEIPLIEEKYRVDISIEYSVLFLKKFSFELETLPTAQAISLPLNIDRTCSRIRIDAIGSISLRLDKSLSQYCVLLSAGFSRLVVSSAVNYAKDIYGVEDGNYWGYNIYGKKYAKIFAKAAYQEDTQELLPQCLKDLAKKVRNDQCDGSSIKEEEIKECATAIYNMIDEEKVKDKLIESRKKKVYNRIKRQVDRGLRKYEASIRRSIDEIYDREIGNELRKYSKVEVFGFNIRTSLPSALNRYVVKKSSEIILPSLDENQETILENYEEGFLEGFEEGFKKRLEEDIIYNLENYCAYR